jgi:hypothetical protein
LFDGIRAACAPLPGFDPARVGAGLPDMQRVPGWTMPAHQDDMLSLFAGFAAGQAVPQPMSSSGFGAASAYLAGLMPTRPIGMI